ncbi:MAG: glycosyl transferase family 2 [Thermoplasmata archaeon]|nr:MAG: glycosyl transferase family 2 [Thermoplasmata archaeon]
MTKISVVLTTKNEEKHIGELLESLLHQEEPYEVIVVDSNSTDKTQEIVENYSKKKPNIKLLIHPGNRAESMNYGIKNATGDAIAFIGGDDIADKNWIKEIRKTIKNADIVVGKLEPLKKQKIKNIENVKLYHKGTNISYPGTNTTYKKEILDKLNGFDPWFSSAEDLEINIRAIDLGYKITENKKAIVYYRAKNNLFAFLKQAFWYGYGRKLIDLKHGNIWKKHSATEIIRKQTSILGLIRLLLGFLGYIYCVFTVKEYSPE